MAEICAYCGSGDTAALADRVVCYTCGRRTGYDGYNGVGTLREEAGPDGIAEIRPQSVDEPT